jgi:hypothetical protein
MPLCVRRSLCGILHERIKVILSAQVGEETRLPTGHRPRSNLISTFLVVNERGVYVHRGWDSATWQ